ncbi:Serine acetyltransferase [Paraburkholderia sabiae]|uniref:DapH/DapD/GlmU-related protein n=2 Tax=Paraburkholderia sabiae TaxID=273251 RepID=A0ABU9QRY0_9BURK|nr:DapH/DapD/GlmU-related protein [Paraburkholderia sabiae]CAD6563109.1 Serine acetyltransferase [Paraburkholderia sabiae]
MLYIWRLARFFYVARIPFLPWILKVLNRILFSTSVPPSVRVGRNVSFGYQGLGIVVHRHAVLGDNIVIAPNVVIGGRGMPGAPVIQNDVLIGAGACVLGPVTIGRGARIGANAVVLTDVPENATAVGNPARILRRDGDCRA